MKFWYTSITNLLHVFLFRKKFANEEKPKNFRISGIEHSKLTIFEKLKKNNYFLKSKLNNNFY